MNLRKENGQLITNNAVELSDEVLTKVVGGRAERRDHERYHEHHWNHHHRWNCSHHMRPNLSHFYEHHCN